MTELYFASVSETNHRQLLQEYSDDFSKSFFQRLLQYRRWQDAQLSMLGRLLLKHGFRKNNRFFSDKDLIYSEYKKPMLKNQSLKFNISHSGDIAICVISDVSEVGVDLEKMKKIDIEDFKSNMTPYEWSQIVNSDFQKDAFFNYWTQKESILKASGKGLSIPLQSFEVVGDRSQLESDTFFLKQVDVNADYKCHIAFKNKNAKVPISVEEINFHI